MFAELPIPVECKMGDFGKPAALRISLPAMLRQMVIELDKRDIAQAMRFQQMTEGRNDAFDRPPPQFHPCIPAHGLFVQQCLPNQEAHSGCM